MASAPAAFPVRARAPPALREILGAAAGARGTGRGLAGVARLAGLAFRLEAQGCAVHAVALARGARPVREDMPEMAVAPRAVHLGALHVIGLVARGAHSARERPIEARPARAAVKLRVRLEQGLSAARAAKDAGPMLIIERARARALRTMTAQHPVLLGGQRALPLGLRLLHGRRRGARARRCRHGVTPLSLSSCSRAAIFSSCRQMSMRRAR